MEFLFALRRVLWGGGTIALLLGTGIFLSLRTRFLPLRNMGKALGLALSAESRKAASGGVSPFSALMTALSATIGTGNIVGVAAALTAGGPGALVWMELSSLPALATKFSECFLSVKYRRRDQQGAWAGGPMYVMETCLGRPGRLLGLLFSLSALLVALSVGSCVQSNAMAEALADSFALSPLLVGAVTALAVFFVSQGGIRSISRMAEILVPIMGIGYLAAGLWVILCHLSALPGAILAMLRDAFSLQAAAGGLLGAAFSQGVARGVLTHEAGLGSAAITAACSDDGDPLRQGYIAETSVVFDTFILCSITGLAICCAGVMDGELTGAALTIAAFETVFGHFGGAILSIAIVLFAFSSILGWAYQGEAAFQYLFGLRPVPLFRLAFAASAFFGAVVSMETVLALSDIANALMCYPNLICLLLLSGTVAKGTQKS